MDALLPMCVFVGVILLSAGVIANFGILYVINRRPTKTVLGKKLEQYPFCVNYLYMGIVHMICDFTLIKKTMNNTEI